MYSWGCTDQGIGSHGLGYDIKESDFYLPHAVDWLRGKKIVQIAASGDISNDKNAISLALTGITIKQVLTL